MAASSPATAPKLPLDIIYNIGLVLSNNTQSEVEEYIDSEFDPANRPNQSALHRLTYLSKATKDLLEPLLYRYFQWTTPQDVVNSFITLIQRPEVRPHVQCISSFAAITGPGVRKKELPLCKKLWAKRCPSDKPALMRLLDEAGLHKLAWSACMLERTKQRFMFSPDFKHDGILELMFAAILFLTPNVTNFVWRDMNTNPKAFILDHVMGDAVKSYPIMPKLRFLNTEKSAFVEAKQAQFFTSHINLWDNLQTLYLNDIDLDVEFIEMICNGDFKKNRPIKELRIRCVSGSEIPGSMSSFDPDFELSSTELLDANDPDKDKDKFEGVFPHLEYLEVRLVHHQERHEQGSRTLKAFLHAVGCPKVLKLEGHRLPRAQLTTGIIHDRLEHLTVREHSRDGGTRTMEKDVLIKGLNSWWATSSHLVPNLKRIDWDHYKLQREDLDDETVWQMTGEEEWEDDSNDDYGDDYYSDELFGDDEDHIEHLHDNVYYNHTTGEVFQDGYEELMAALQLMEANGDLPPGFRP
ncbi:hypothetical protein LB507_001590 [Fusarium sp. FIESC RH6]|nr:hypothetical protein LB507_001590 [Fusarium sp. FIESC RH6]